MDVGRIMLTGATMRGMASGNWSWGRMGKSDSDRIGRAATPRFTRQNAFYRNEPNETQMRMKFPAASGRILALR
jgi:hypothetical protein